MDTGLLGSQERRGVGEYKLFSTLPRCHFGTMRAGALLCALFLGVASAGVVQPCSWKLFKQCDSRWAQHPLGTSSNTICSDGCAMSSVAMSVASKGETINGTAITPGAEPLRTRDRMGCRAHRPAHAASPPADTLNRWLTEHSGYADKDLIVWNAVSALGALHTTDSTHSLPIDKLRDHVKQCHPVIVNVRNGTHWVLVTGAPSRPRAPPILT